MSAMFLFQMEVGLLFVKKEGPGCLKTGQDQLSKQVGKQMAHRNVSCGCVVVLRMSSL